MTSTPRLSNGQPAAEKMPGSKPHKAGKKPSKKKAAPAVAKPVEMAAPEPVKPAPAPAKPAPAMPAPAMPMPPKLALLPVPAFDSAVDSFERSCKAAGQGAHALSAVLFDMTRANITSGFEFMASLSAARHPADLARLQISYFDERMRALLDQARELRVLSADIVAKANEPIRAHLNKSFTAKAA